MQLKWKYQFQFAGFIVAKEKGYYADEGLAVTLFENNSSADIYDQVQYGKINFAVADDSLVYQLMQKRPFIAMMAIFQESPYLLVALESSGIDTLEEIEGKTIAMDGDLKGTAIEAMLTSNNIRYTKSDPSYHIDALLNKKVDLMTAYITNEIYAANEKNISLNVFKPTFINEQTLK